LTSLVRLLRVIENPPSSLSRCTFAELVTDSGSWPAWLRTFASCIEKQPAWAAAVSSSGLVPSPSPNREVKV